MEKCDECGKDLHQRQFQPDGKNRCRDCQIKFDKTKPKIRGNPFFGNTDLTPYREACSDMARSDYPEILKQITSKR